MAPLKKAWIVLFVMFTAILFYVPDASLDFIARRDILLRWALTTGVGALFIEELFLFAFWVWMCFCMISNDNQVATLSMTMLLLFLFFYLGIKRNSNEKFITTIYNGIAIIILIHISVMVLQAFDIKTLFYVLPKYKETFIPGTALNTNEGGALLGISLPVFFRKKWCWFLLAVIPALVIQKAFAAIIVSAIVIFMFVSISYKEKLRLIVPFAALAIAFSVYVYMKNYDKSYISGSGFSKRFNCWKHSVEQISLRSPVKGFGLGSFPYVYPVMSYKLYQEKDFSPEVFKWEKGTASVYRAHNDWIELAFDAGFIALLFFANWVVYSLIFYLKYPFKTLNLTLASIMVVGACVSSCFHFLARTPAFLIPIAAMAMMNSSKDKNREVIDGKASL